MPAVVGKTRSQIADEFGLSGPRISQLLTQGKLRTVPGNRKLIDYPHALAFRQNQMQDRPQQVLFTKHSNNGKHHNPEKARALMSRLNQKTPEPEDDLDEIDLSVYDDGPDDPGEPAAFDEAGYDAAQVAAIQAGNEMQQLKIQEMREKVARARLQREREAGRSVEREHVLEQGRTAGKLISNMLAALPDQIAAEFANEAMRSAVRENVRLRVDQALDALAAGLKEAIGEVSDDA